MVEGSLHKVTEPPWEGRESVAEQFPHLHPVDTLEWGNSEGGPGKVAFLPQQVQLAGREVGYFRRTVQSDRAFVEALVVEEVGAAGAVDCPSVWQTPVAPR